MKLGGFGFMKQDGILHVPKNITESLAMNDQCILFGVYYPPSDYGKEGDNNYQNDLDFVFSSIPFRDWPFSARFTIRVRRQSIAFQEISKFFSTNDITIVHASSTRSGHRFSTLDFHVIFEKLKKEGFDIKKLNPEKSCYQPTLDLLIDTKKMLEEINVKNNFLFIDKKQIYLDNPISEKINQALHYYYWKSVEKQLANGIDENTKEFNIYKPFSLRFFEGEYLENLDQIITNSGGKIANIIHIVNEVNRNDDVTIPSIVFVESDTNALHLRARIIPNKQAYRFLKLEISHQRYGLPASTKGLLDLIVNKILTKEGFKIWSYFTQLYECRNEFGAGKLTFFVESKKDYNFNDNAHLKFIQSRLSEATIELNTFIKSNKGVKLNLSRVVVNSPNIIPLRETLSKKFNRPWPIAPRYKYDVFISYVSEDKNNLTNLEKKLENKGVIAYSAEDKISSGKDLTEEIFTQIRNAREFCLLYSSKSNKSDWILFELSAALALGKEVSLVFVDTIRDNVRIELKTLAHSKLHRSLNIEGDVEKYASELLSRRYID